LLLTKYSDAGKPAEPQISMPWLALETKLATPVQEVTRLNLLVYASLVQLETWGTPWEKVHSKNVSNINVRPNKPCSLAWLVTDM
jgi:hypothetical protein